MIKKQNYIAIFAVVAGIFFAFGAVFLPKNKKNDVQKINFIIIAVDSLRPDHLSCYGYERHTSAAIDRLAQEGTMFTQAISAGGWTFESVPSILTGAYSFVHKVDYGGTNKIDPSVRTLAQLLSVKSYQTVIWSNHPAVKYLDVKNSFQETNVESLLNGYKPAVTDSMLTGRIQSWLRSYKGTAPFFFYVHYWGSHVPYRPPFPYNRMYSYDKYRIKSGPVVFSSSETEEESSNGVGAIPYLAVENNIADPNYYIAQYDGTVSYMDAQISRLMDTLKKSGLDKNTVFILTADHGEMLGEHDMYFMHGRGQEENIRVPLIIRSPGIFPQGRVVSRQVSLIDIAPTILEIAGLSRPSFMQGESLLSLVKPFRRYFKEYVFSSQKEYLTLRTKSWKLIYDSKIHSSQVYNLQKDPRESRNLIKEEPRIARDLKNRLISWTNNYSAYESLDKKKGRDLSRMNFIMITIDSLRPDHLGCYGYNKNTSPNIDGLAKEGVRFTQAIGLGSCAFESTPAVLTGRYCFSDRLDSGYVYSSGSYPTTLARELSKNGYQTVLWSSHPGVKHSGIKDSFEEVNTATLFDDAALTNKIQIYLQDRAHTPFFLYIHYWGSHAPYSPPNTYKHMFISDAYNKNHSGALISIGYNGEAESYTGATIPFASALNNITDPDYYISQYDAAVYYADTQIGKLINTLKDLGLNKNTVLVVMSDHGQMLGEHNMYFSHSGGYEENIKVPLIISYPELFPPGKMISRQMSLIDVAPTVLEIAGLSKPEFMQGESLLSLTGLYPSYRSQKAFFIQDKELVLRTGSWKIMYNTQEGFYSLFNLQDDPKELKNVINNQPKVKISMESSLNDFIGSMQNGKKESVSGNNNALFIEEMRKMGYW